MLSKPRRQPARGHKRLLSSRWLLCAGLLALFLYLRQEQEQQQPGKTALPIAVSVEQDGLLYNLYLLRALFDPVSAEIDILAFAPSRYLSLILPTSLSYSNLQVTTATTPSCTLRPSAASV